MNKDLNLKFQKVIEICTERFMQQGHIDLIKSAKVALGELENNVIAFEYNDGDYVNSMIGHAETRLRDLVKEYVKDGFNVFVAALGSDKANIDKIYEDVSFIDITDPSELPTNMLRAIKRTI